MPNLFPLSGVDELIKTGGSCRVNAKVKPRFAEGEKIVVRNINPVSHTRLPQYVRGKHGTIRRDHGVFVFPDTSALGQGEQAQHVYSVVFTAREIWGSGAPEKDKIYIDLWDDYMDPAG